MILTAGLAGPAMCSMGGRAPRAVPGRLPVAQTLRGRTVAPNALDTWSTATRDTIGTAIPGIGPKNEQLLRSQGLLTVEDLERVHFELHRADINRTKLFLQDVVGIKNRAAVKNILSFLDSDATPPALALSAPASFDEALQHEPAVMSLLANYAGLSLDRLQNMLLAGTSDPGPRYMMRQEDLASLLDHLVAEGKVQEEDGLFKYKSLGRSGSPNSARLSPARRSSPSPSRAGSPGPSSSSQSPGWGNGYTNNSVQAERDADLELAQYEGQVLDLLKASYDGMTLDSLHAVMSEDEPRFRQGSSRLQLLLDAMSEQGSVACRSGVWRDTARSSPPAVSRSSSSQPKGTPVPARAPSASTSSWDAPSAPRGSPASASSLLRSSSAAAPVPRSSPQAARAPSAAPIASYEPAVLDLLQNYAGLTVERLNSLLSSSPKAPGYSGNASQLSQLLAELTAAGKITVEDGMYRFRSKTPTPARPQASPLPGRGPSPTGSRAGAYQPGSPAPARAAAASPAPARGASAPSASGRSSVAPLPVAPAMAVYEPAVLDLLQSYAGLSLERLLKLLESSPKAPGFSANPAQLASLLSGLVARGRVSLEGGLYRYRSTGKTPPQARKRASSSSAGSASGGSGLAGSSVDGLVSSMGSFIDKARRSLSPAPLGSSGSTAAPAPAAARSVSPAAAVISAQQTEWAPFENTLMTLVTNYGALPLERLHEMMRASMVWPRFDKSTAQLGVYLETLIASGRLVCEDGLYRKAGTTGSPAPGFASKLQQSISQHEGHVLATLGSYSGLTLERLHNMLRMSTASPKYDLAPEQLAMVLGSLQGQGKVIIESGMYKAAALPKSDGSTDNKAVGAAEGATAGIPALDNLGFATGEGLIGFTPFVEVLNGRFAMLGLAASLVQELRNDAGTLEQLGFHALPSMEIMTSILATAGGITALAAVVQIARYASGNMSPMEAQRHQRFFTLQSQELVDEPRFPTPELKYARTAELANGRAAMVGILAAIVMEALSGRGIVGQVVLYLKVAGVLTEQSGF